MPVLAIDDAHFPVRTRMALEGTQGESRHDSKRPSHAWHFESNRSSRYEATGIAASHAPARLAKISTIWLAGRPQDISNAVRP